MNKHIPNPITRRRAMQSAALGTLAASLPLARQASAQGLLPADRVKGPPVWLDLDQEELDAYYDNDGFVTNHDAINERREANNEIALARIGRPEIFSYGPSDIEKIEIYRSQAPSAPVAMFLHGGAWRGGRAGQVAYMAECFIDAGAHFAPVDFASVLNTEGNLFTLVEQVRRATVWVYRNARSFGGDPNRIYLIGHSAGGHLGGCAVTTDWEAQGLPRDILKGALLGSGMYDLKPVRLSRRSDYVSFTDAMEEALSPQRHIDRIHTPIFLTYGAFETPEFQRQSRDFYAALIAAGKPAKIFEGIGYNHYETQETLGSPYGFMGRVALEMMNLTPG
jgi:arylformamidase